MRNEAVYQTVCSICDDAGIPHPVAEHRFDQHRKWRFDFAWPTELVALECEGGIYARRASHSSIKGMLRDIEKGNAATVHGWRIIRTTWQELGDGIRLCAALMNGTTHRAAPAAEGAA